LNPADSLPCFSPAWENAVQEGYMSADFWERLILQLVGPLVTVIVGSLMVGLLVAWVTRRAQERRADDQRREERVRAEYTIRVGLIDDMTETASGLYMGTQRYWRKKTVEKAGDVELADERGQLDRQYQTSRVMGEVIEQKLDAYLDSPEAKLLWHSTMDLLTVRYFYLIGLMTRQLLEENAGTEHTRLDVDQLRNPKLLLDTYHERLIQATGAVLQATFRPFAD
jgi:membrane protein implicated in regulation of membrane protease activity